MKGRNESLKSPLPSPDTRDHVNIITDLERLCLLTYSPDVPGSGHLIAAGHATVTQLEGKEKSNG